METTLSLENRIESELNAAGILNGKARRFFVYAICRTLPGLEIENKISEKKIIRRYAGLLPRTDFPFFKSNRKLLILPSDVVLNEVLYSDRDLSMFFIKYARFCLLLEVLFETYPSWFEFLSLSPDWVPAPHTRNTISRFDVMLKEYTKQNEHPAPEEKKNGADLPDDKRLYDILTQLSGCHYLPFSSDFTPHNQSLFDAIINSSTP
jgi:hypothetical protein